MGDDKEFEALVQESLTFSHIEQELQRSFTVSHLEQALGNNIPQAETQASGGSNSQAENQVQTQQSDGKE